MTLAGDTACTRRPALLASSRGPRGAKCGRSTPPPRAGACLYVPGKKIQLTFSPAGEFRTWPKAKAPDRRRGRLAVQAQSYSSRQPQLEQDYAKEFMVFHQTSQIMWCDVFTGSSYVDIQGYWTGKSVANLAGPELMPLEDHGGCPQIAYIPKLRVDLKDHKITRCDMVEKRKPTITGLQKDPYEKRDATMAEKVLIPLGLLGFCALPYFLMTDPLHILG
eukprot:g65147.t1